MTATQVIELVNEKGMLVAPTLGRQHTEYVGGLVERELDLMAEGRSKALWAHTSHVLALLANVNRDPKKTKAFAPADFDPHARKLAARPVAKVPLASLRGLIMGAMPTAAVKTPREALRPPPPATQPPSR